MYRSCFIIIILCYPLVCKKKNLETKRNWSRNTVLECDGVGSGVCLGSGRGRGLNLHERVSCSSSINKYKLQNESTDDRRKKS